MLIQEINTYKVYINGQSKTMGNNLFDINDDYPLESFEFPFYDADFLVTDVLRITLCNPNPYRRMMNHQIINNIDGRRSRYGKKLIDAIRKQYEATTPKRIYIDFFNDNLTIEPMVINKFENGEADYAGISEKLKDEFDDGFEDKRGNLKYSVQYILYKLWKECNNQREKEKYLKNIARALSYYADHGEITWDFDEKQKRLSEDTLQRLVDNYFKNKRIDTFLRATHKAIFQKRSITESEDTIDGWNYNIVNSTGFKKQLSIIKRIFETPDSGYKSNDKTFVAAICLLLFYAYIKKETISFNTFRNTITEFLGFEPNTYKENKVKEDAYLIYVYSLHCKSSEDLPINDGGYWNKDKSRKYIESHFSKTRFSEDYINKLIKASSHEGRVPLSWCKSLTYNI